jgi:putative transposase
MKYVWRKLTPQQREELRERRLQLNHPPNSIPHKFDSRTNRYMITATCFEHRAIIGQSSERMSEFERDLIHMQRELCLNIFAWSVLPNHYHTLIETTDLAVLLKKLGQLHGRTSFKWNGEDNQRGRKVWCNAVETAMKSERHFFASLNYVLNNPVHHGYAKKWENWPYSNAQQYIANIGRNEAIRIWKSYPIKEYGKEWDPPEM